MKQPEIPQIEISPAIRTFLLLSITLAYHMFSTGFELGVHGELFYTHKLVAWAFVTGALVAFIIIPKRITGIKVWQLVVLLIPSMWAVLTSYFGVQNQGEIIRPGLFLLATVSYLICLPYAIYIVVEIVNPDLLEVKGYKPKIGIFFISMAFFVAGYFYGDYNYLFLTCQDFEIAGGQT